VGRIPSPPGRESGADRMPFPSGPSLRRALRAPAGLALKHLVPMIAPAPQHEFAVCAIFREEAPFLDEWLGFHAGVGATHFHLYNNFSTDHFRDVLAPWIARGMVTLTDWPVPVGQVSAYRHCVRQVRHSVRWLAFIDIDEFLFAPDTRDIRPVLNRYADLPGIEVWQAFFGSGGHAARPALPVTEAYTMRAPLVVKTTVKTIANPRLIYKPDVHQHKYWLGDALDPERRRVPHDEPSLEGLRINHYWSRSLADLHDKVARGDASTAALRQLDSHLAFERTLNGERDESILPVARAIRGGAA
jgi:hypothetical protein